jgi:hypothetical protein
MLFQAPDSGGLNLERLRDHLYSMRVDLQYRIILHKGETRAPALLFVGNHDDAYRFASRTPEWAAASIAPPNVLYQMDHTAGAEDEDLQFERLRAENIEAYTVPSAPAAAETVETLIRTRKYLPLARHLLTQPLTHGKHEITFRGVEQIIVDRLPRSASAHRAWWANDPGHVQAAAWLAVGWNVASVNISKQVITLERTAQRS